MGAFTENGRQQIEGTIMASENTECEETRKTKEDIARQRTQLGMKRKPLQEIGTRGRSLCVNNEHCKHICVSTYIPTSICTCLVITLVLP